MNPKPIHNHVRQHHSLLARAEKKALTWLAERTPGWVNSDHLTALGFLSMVLAAISCVAARRYPPYLVAVVVALALNWLGDSLDGTLARVRNRQRPRYGFYVDHVLDVAGTAILLGGLALSGYMSPMISVGLLAAFVMVQAEVFLATCVGGVFRLSSMGVGPTELRIVLAAGTLYLLHDPFVHWKGIGTFLLFDVGGVVAIAGLGFAFVRSAAHMIAVLYREEPLPR
jgi:archaetidylinositol phosphate synthase